jgi:hypothetical protein
MERADHRWETAALTGAGRREVEGSDDVLARFINQYRNGRIGAGPWLEARGVDLGPHRAAHQQAVADAARRQRLDDLLGRDRRAPDPPPATETRGQGAYAYAEVDARDVSVMQRLAAERTATWAAVDLRLGRLTVRYFDAAPVGRADYRFPHPVRGFFDATAGGGVVWLKRGMSESDTRETTAHEVFHSDWFWRHGAARDAADVRREEAAALLYGKVARMVLEGDE